MEEQGKKKCSNWRILLWSVLGLLAVLTAAAVLFMGVNRFSLEITVAGENDVTLEYGEHYEDAGAQANFVGTLFLKSGYPVEITSKNQVHEDVLGTYTVEYAAEFLWYTATAQRTVTVVDTQRPLIKLVYTPGKYTLPNEKYEEEGFIAYDNHDGNITDRVVRIEKDGYVWYKVEDSSGNRAAVGRCITYDDPIAPELTLEGERQITLTAGDSYTESGYTAVDNVDGDLTQSVTVTGNVDIYRAGTYTLEYEVADSYGNTDRETRTVTVVARPQPNVVIPTGKVIYLTFDDGPSAHTERLLQILDQYNVKATFFLVNTGKISIAQQISAAGHSVGIHSVSHDYSAIYASEEAFFNDLLQMQRIIKEQTGVETTLMRFPGGSSNMVSSFNPGIMTVLTQAVQDMGFQYFDWNVSSSDAGGAKSAEEVFQNVVNGIGNRNTAVVLQHDSMGFSVDAVEKIIVWGLANGYTFLPLDPTSPTAHHGVNN